MKRIITFIVVLMLSLSFCACNNGQSDEVELTLDNYSTYLNVTNLPLFTGKSWRIQPLYSPNTILCNSQAECEIEVKAASPNYDYNNVVITLNVIATYDTFEGFNETTDVVSKKQVEISCDIGGNGTARAIIFKGKDKKYQIEEDSLNLEWNIVSVSGTVTRIK